MMDSNQPLSEQFRIVAKKWVDADSAASMLEETKSAVLSKWMSEMGDMPVSKAEMAVKASDKWVDYVKSMVEARQQAAMLKVQLEYIRMRFHEWQSHAANRRAEMKL
jgi:23S rRNA maturation mini-RNase III